MASEEVKSDLPRNVVVYHASGEDWVQDLEGGRPYKLADAPHLTSRGVCSEGDPEAWQCSAESDVYDGVQDLDWPEGMDTDNIDDTHDSDGRPLLVVVFSQGNQLYVLEMNTKTKDIVPANPGPIPENSFLSEMGVIAPGVWTLRVDPDTRVKYYWRLP